MGGWGRGAADSPLVKQYHYYFSSPNRISLIIAISTLITAPSVRVVPRYRLNSGLISFTAVIEELVSLAIFMIIEPEHVK